MAWFKLDDQFHSQPKVIAAGNAAIGLYCRLGTYCADKLTDGFIPEAVARSMGASRELRALVECPIPDTRPLLTKAPGGYIMRDYLEFNPTREKVLGDRESAKKRMNRLRGSPDVQANTTPNTTPNSGRSSDPPRPRPDPPTSSYTQTDDLQHAGVESSSVELAIKIAARAVYLLNPSAVNGGNPQRYIDGTADNMRTERWHDFAALTAHNNPIQIAATIVGSRDAAEEAAIALGIPVPPPAPPCPTCDDYRIVTIDEATHTTGPCPTCTTTKATA